MSTSKAFAYMMVPVLAVFLSDACPGQENRGEAQQQPQQPGMPQPTDAHKLLHKDVDTWDATMKIWLQEDGEPLESMGTETNELLPGGMWLISRFKSDFAGMPFTGVGTIGYDPVERKYVGTWVDSISPHLTILKGDYDPKTKTLTSTAEGRDFETGEVTKSKHISRYLDDNTRTFEMHAKDRGGAERKIMEITYKRRAE